MKQTLTIDISDLTSYTNDKKVNLLSISSNELGFDFTTFSDHSGNTNKVLSDEERTHLLHKSIKLISDEVIKLLSLQVGNS